MAMSMIFSTIAWNEIKKIDFDFCLNENVIICIYLLLMQINMYSTIFMVEKKEKKSMEKV